MKLDFRTELEAAVALVETLRFQRWVEGMTDDFYHSNGGYAARTRQIEEAEREVERLRREVAA